MQGPLLALATWRNYRAGTFPLDLVPRMGALGMFGANLSGYGLPAIDNIAYGLMLRESGVIFDDETAFPGYAAALPVLLAAPPPAARPRRSR